MGEEMYRRTGGAVYGNELDVIPARSRAGGVKLVIYALHRPDPGYADAAQRLMEDAVPGVDEVIDIFISENGDLCVVAAPSEGRVLGDMLDENRVDPADAADMIREIAGIVRKIHARGLAYDGLRLSRIRQTGPEGLRLTPPTRAFSADAAAADIRSIGAIFFRLRTNREEFEGGSARLAALPDNERRFVQRCTSGHYGADSRALAKDIEEMLPRGDEEKPDKNAAAERTLRFAIIVTACVILAVVIYLLVAAGRTLTETGGRSTEQTAAESGRITVPDLSGMTVEEATGTLTARGIGIRDAGEMTSNAAAGTIVNQTPSAGTEVGINSTVVVYTSAGPVSVRMPDLVGRFCSEAEEELRDAGYDNVQLVKETSSSVKCGRVISTSPAGGKRTATTEEVTLHVSLGESDDIEVEIKDLRDMTEIRALEACCADGIFPTVQTGYSDITRSGRVMAQSIEPRMVTKIGAEIAVTVASEDNPPLSRDEKWNCAAVLDDPGNYGGGAYRLVLEETVGDALYELTAEEGDALSFPYSIAVSGIRGSDTGVLRLYESTGNGYVSRCTWNLDFAEEEN